MSNNIVRKNSILRMSMLNHFLRYDKRNNVDSVDLVVCKKLNYGKKPPIFKFIINNKVVDASIINKYDFLGNDKFIPLANKKTIDLIKNLNQDDFETFDALIVDYYDKIISYEYKLINILSKIQIADMSKSVIDECFIQNNLKFSYYSKLSLKTDIKINNSHMFRDEINNGITKYVSGEFYNVYKDNKLTGLTFSVL